MGFQSKYTGTQIEERLDLISDVHSKVENFQQETIEQLEQIVNEKLQDLLSDLWIEL